MDHPSNADYIDIHTHDSAKTAGIYAIENIMAHESRSVSDLYGRPCTYGIHPWHLSNETADNLLRKVNDVSSSPNLLAIGEAGFDKLRGPEPAIQSRVFESQVIIAEKIKKPMVIHCVRAWDELLSSHKRLRPAMPWLIHGFRGKPELALQLISKGMYLSFWFDFVIRPESSRLLRSVSRDRIFLETDGADIDIREIYKKVSADLGVKTEELNRIIHSNFKSFFFQEYERVA